MALDGVTATAASGGGNGVPAAGGAAATGGGMSFRTFLSDINPLQYIPVVGAVYRAMTGDEGNSTMRFVASLGTSFAIGGPLGLGVTVAEKITGIDPERIARSLLSKMFHHGAAQAATTTPPVSAIASTSAGSGDAANRPWTAAELSAYAAATGGLTGTSAGSGAALAASASAGGTVTADMLNGMELQRITALYA